MKATWSSTCGGEGIIKLAYAKKCSYNGEDLNTLAASDVYKSMKINKNSKEKVKAGSDLENEVKRFNLERLR